MSISSFTKSSHNNFPPIWVVLEPLGHSRTAFGIIFLVARTRSRIRTIRLFYGERPIAICLAQHRYLVSIRAFIAEQVANVIRSHGVTGAMNLRTARMRLEWVGYVFTLGHRWVISAPSTNGSHTLVGHSSSISGVGVDVGRPRSTRLTQQQEGHQEKDEKDH